MSQLLWKWGLYFLIPHFFIGYYPLDIPHVWADVHHTNESNTNTPFDVSSHTHMFSTCSVDFSWISLVFLQTNRLYLECVVPGSSASCWHISTCCLPSRMSMATRHGQTLKLTLSLVPPGSMYHTLVSLVPVFTKCIHFTFPMWIVDCNKDTLNFFLVDSFTF